MQISKFCIVCLVHLVLYYSVSSKAAGKIQTFNNSKTVSAFGLFRDKKPPTWERGQIVGYSLVSAMGELHFKSESRNDSTVIFKYPSLINTIYLDKIPKWSELTVGKTVLVEFQPGKFQTRKIVARFNSDKNDGKVIVQISKRMKKFDYRNLRLQGMDVCRYFEVDCDNELEDCQQIYLNKWLPAPAQYQCSCKEGFKRHPTKTCIPLNLRDLVEEPNEEEFEKSTGRKESKSIRVISGSLASCLGVISVVACVFWRNFFKKTSSEERLRKEIIKEMQATWGVNNEDLQEKTLLSKISYCLRRFSAKTRNFFADLIQKLQGKRRRATDNNSKINLKTTENDTKVDLKTTENHTKIHLKMTENDTMIHLKTIENDTNIDSKTTENDTDVDLETTENDTNTDLETTKNGTDIDSKRTENDTNIDLETTENDTDIDLETTENDTNIDLKTTENGTDIDLKTAENDTKIHLKTTENDTNIDLKTTENDIHIDSKTTENGTEIDLKDN